MVENLPHIFGAILKLVDEDGHICMLLITLNFGVFLVDSQSCSRGQYIISRVKQRALLCLRRSNPTLFLKSREDNGNHLVVLFTYTVRTTIPYSPIFRHD
jgi:hypothetical protein